MRNSSLRLRNIAVAVLAVPLAGAAVSRVERKDPVLTARHLNQGASLKVFNATGAVRLVGWSHDSLEVRGNITPRNRYYGVGDSNGAKVGVEETRPGDPPTHGDLTIFVPRGATVSVKTVNGDIDATDVSGWFYTVSGAARIGGSASSVEVTAMRGDVDLAVAAPWMRVRAGAGRVTLHGAVPDADVSTIGGTLDVVGAGIMRGQFASVTGDIHWTGAPAAGAILDFSNHSGAVEFALPKTTAASFSLSTVSGTISNGFAQVRPVSRAERSIRVTFGRGGADVAVRTFKGAIRMRPQ